MQAFESARAAHGEALLQTEPLTPGVVPELIIRNLWVAWGMSPPASDAEFWALARARYGMLEAPFDNGGLPLGMRRDAAGLVAFDCLLCHGGRVAGTTVLGAANVTIDLETFFDDLIVMRDLAPSLGLPHVPVPFDLDGLTSAAGAQDAFGLGFRVAAVVGGAGVNTKFGPQQAPAWWLLQYKNRIYVDGSGAARSHHSMMATLLAFGMTPDQLAARDEDFLDIAHYVRSIAAPCWDLSTLDEAKWSRGHAVFERECASCHGVHSGPDAGYPDEVVELVDVQTDPVRATRFGAAEAGALNASWFGDPPFEATGGYLAQPLVGIWARAPYFHNGSVPNLLAVLDPAQRPIRWRRLGSERENYDIERVGLRFEDVAEPTTPADSREGRLVYDTAREGMGNGGHLYGAKLSAAERDDVLEYLRSL